MIRTNVEEDKEAIMVKFLNDLNKDITNVVEVERKIKHKGAIKYISGSSSSMRPNQRNEQKSYPKGIPKRKDEDFAYQ